MGYPLSYAFGNGCTEMVKFLLNAGANATHEHALSCASRNGHAEIVELLLHAGANVYLDLHQ